MLSRTHLALLSATAAWFVLSTPAMALNPQPLPPGIYSPYGKLSGPTTPPARIPSSIYMRKAGGDPHFNRAH